jgi:hypothetical protein
LQSGVKGIANWWQKVNASPSWQENIFLGLAIAYAVIGLVALIQLIRIELRVPEYGWTTQKVFHLLNFIVNGVRAVVFCFRESVQALSPEVLQHILLDLPGLLFFTTYTLLVLFWAEIYYQVQLCNPVVCLQWSKLSVSVQGMVGRMGAHNLHMKLGFRSVC